MAKDSNGVTEVALFVAGLVTAAFLTNRRLTDQDSVGASRVRQLELRIEQQSARLSEVLAANQTLDERLSTQVQSIELLKNTVLQTDHLLERVLESLESLHSLAAPDDNGGASGLHPETV
jgi:hypothetical protein